jgi:ribosomal protein L11 methylase PrmA
MAPGGKLILSGMMAEQEAEVIATAQAHGLSVIGRKMEEDWVALVVERRA